MADASKADSVRTEKPAPSRPAGAREYGVLLAASFSPPITGQSSATGLLLEALMAGGVPTARVNLARPFRPQRSGLRKTSERLARVLDLVPRAVWQGTRLRAKEVVLYLQLAGSVAGMMRDLPLLSWAAVAGWRTVVHLHGETFRDAYATAGPLLRGAVAGALARVDRAIVLSERLRSQFEGLVPPDRLEVVSNGVSGEVERAAEGVLERRANQGGTGLRAVFLSNLLRAKGYEQVLEAARLAKEAGLPHQFILAGAPTEWMGEDPSRFRTRHSLDNLEVMGPVYAEAKWKLLEGADVLLLPSLQEGQPIVILEAMHFGLPVIATAVGGVPDTVRDGETGLLLARGSAGEMLEALNLLGADSGRRIQMGVLARKIAQRDYTAAEYGRRMVEVFDAVAASRRTRGRGRQA
jgi:glycosyltransferase involved in cell wall biosynthesis